ncbi:MAG: YigZ family protein [Lachnospiraceae bacterium]|nr:YigZ family protein [Lachnospiraceae bacterium]
MFKTIHTNGTGEIEEKKSRFIAHVAKVTTEEEAVAFITQKKKEFFDARHNCSAFVIGENQELTRCSDDGEPSGTAGRPMLEVLLNEGITNVCVVVTRYFGGTLLGTGGLVRAYQGAVKEGLNNSVIIEWINGNKISISCDYTDVGKLQYIFANKNCHIITSDYGADVSFTIVIGASSADELIKQITEATAARAKITSNDDVTFADANGEILLSDAK